MVFLRQMLILFPLFIAMRLIAEKISKIDKEIRDRVIYYFGVIAFLLGGLFKMIVK